MPEKISGCWASTLLSLLTSSRLQCRKAPIMPALCTTSAHMILRASFVSSCRAHRASGQRGMLSWRWRSWYFIMLSLRPHDPANILSQILQARQALCGAHPEPWPPCVHYHGGMQQRRNLRVKEAKALTVIRCARTLFGSRIASGRQTPIFWTSIFQMEAMRLRLAVRTSLPVSLIWTSGSPSFSCSTTSSSPGLETSPWEPWVLPDEFCTPRHLSKERHTESVACVL